MKPQIFDTEAHLLVCTDPRCCQNGAEYLFDALWNAFEREGLAYYKTGGNLRLTKSGCLGACDFGPNMVCYFKQDETLRQAWFHNLGFEMAMQIARALKNGETIPERNRYGT